MSEAHDSIKRAKDKVPSNFYWPGVDGDVTRYCRSCDVCQRTVKKRTLSRVPLEKVPLIDTPFKRVAIDLVGPINPPSEARHRFILTLVDYATRFAEAVPLHKIDTESVAEALLDIYSRLGVPEEVLSDQGTQFISDCMKELEEIALTYSSIFSDRPGTASTEEHCIKLTSSTHVRQSPYPVPYVIRQTLRDELIEMEDLRVIRKSSAPYASPMVVVKKKDGTNHVCIDYRRLNKLTIFDPQPGTPPADIFQGMEKDQYFSKIDLTKGYWKIPVRKQDIPKTAFVTMDYHYEFLRMPFGMMKSGAKLTRAVKKLLCGMDNVVDYIDNLLIHTETWEAHVKILNEIVKRLQEVNFTVRPVKCLLGSRIVDFLGHSLSRDLVRKGQPNIVNWGDSQERAYNSLKVAVTSKPVLQLPDVNKKFVLRTDASDRGLGAALMQENEGTPFPVAYASKKLTDRERKYSVTERKALAIVWGVKKFSLYLYGSLFNLQTDHGALQFLNAAKFDSPRIMRWALALQVYNFDVQYIKSS
ncbi:Zinc finger protein [Plakobranchus ocellatus]|uniref:Zinc finger protein n=1 Tax=Plakobranchus ocellatus TaxID=259542 RepID=A0AAV4AZK6_9GAST|nr:Zinc finger protein [Plakobranchus ocellatus]